jgi:hypothetical protein
MSRRARARRERATLLLLVTLFITMFCVCSYVEHTYTREATVWVNEDGSMSFIDEGGREWVADADNVVHGQKVVLVMDDHCTSSYIKDDVIKKIKPLEIVME